MADSPPVIPDEVLLNATNQYLSFLPEWSKGYLVTLMQMVIKDPYGFLKNVFIILMPLFILSAICSYFLLKEVKKDEQKQKNRDKIKQRAQKVLKEKEKGDQKQPQKEKGDQKQPQKEKEKGSPGTTGETKSPGKSKAHKKKKQ